MNVLSTQNPENAPVFIWGLDMSHGETAVSLFEEVKTLTDKDFSLVVFDVTDWNAQFSPWPAPAVFGKNAFSGKGNDTLRFLEDEFLPEIKSKFQGSETFLTGYSLAGLFALWAGYQSGRFDGIAAASPSVWFPHFTEYMKKRTLLTPAVYLSLGDREEKTRNTVMARVGDAIREGYDILQAAGADCIFEWNKGNHFKDPDLRTARAFAWLINRNK